MKSDELEIIKDMISRSSPALAKRMEATGSYDELAALPFDPCYKAVTALLRKRSRLEPASLLASCKAAAIKAELGCSNCKDSVAGPSRRFAFYRKRKRLKDSTIVDCFPHGVLLSAVLPCTCAGGPDGFSGRFEDDDFIYDWCATVEYDVAQTALWGAL